MQYVGQAREDIFVKCDFKRFGSMQNCSTRVMSVDGVKKFIRQSALMGYNYLQLYTEITFEVPEEPYFGYMKGRYTKEELKEIVAYGKRFEVELVPCTQTLGHMAELFKWKQYYEVKDIERVLLAEKYGFTKPSIWYDNVFHIEFKGYSIPPMWLQSEFSEEIRAAFPQVQMIFWNYVPYSVFNFTRAVNMIKQLSSSVGSDLNGRAPPQTKSPPCGAFLFVHVVLIKFSTKSLTNIRE
ncbi:MAG: hypothetical protein IJA89_05360 [Clostridia bacterium]|nr:hypothetical protein [Clostridia bacterium]